MKNDLWGKLAPVLSSIKGILQVESPPFPEITTILPISDTRPPANGLTFVPSVLTSIHLIFNATSPFLHPCPVAYHKLHGAKQPSKAERLLSGLFDEKKLKKTTTKNWVLWIRAKG